ncbi:MAG: hypothetical protein ACP5N7_02670 [Candidatus Pacearchaeota archaeon]
MVKKVNVLPNSTDSTLETLAELSVLMLGNVSLDNPRSRGFKVLVVDSTAKGSVMGGCYAGHDGRAYVSRKNIFVPSHQVDDPLLIFYTGFVNSLTWRKDKVVVPVREEAYDLIRDLSERKGYELRELRSLDELSGFRSSDGRTMMHNYKNPMELLGL